jgi:hypothetical protein
MSQCCQQIKNSEPMLCVCVNQRLFITNKLVIIYPLHQGRTPTRPRPPYRLLDLHLFDPNRRNLNPMVPAPTTMTVDNTFDFKAYDY